MREWTRFISGDVKTLDKAAIRYLCWVPEIAIDGRFLAYIVSSGTAPNRRCLAGLVRSCHCRWENLLSESGCVSIVRGLIKNYNGSNQVLLKWQTNPDAVLSKSAPLILAERLIHSGKSLRFFVDEWQLEAHSPFFQKVVEIAAARCRDQLNRLPEDVLILLFRDLLPWPGWKLSAFKKEIGALILHRPMNGKVQEILQRFILHYEKLGDPRLPINRIKWAEVPRQATDLFIQWLLHENPFAFPEHVYQQGRGWFWRQKTSGLAPLSFEREEWRRPG